MAALLQFHVILTVTVTKLKYEAASNITCGSKVLELYSYIASGFPPFFYFLWPSRTRHACVFMQ